MANEVSIIETVLTAKTDDHDKKIAASEKKLDDFGKNASDAGFKSWTNKIGNSLQSWGTTLSVGLTAPLALLGNKILDVGFSYEKAMNTFQAVTKATAEEMSRASKVAEKLGADMSLPATSAGDAALAMTELAKGGFTAAQAMDAAKGALQLAAAAQIDEARAAEITANALNTFGLAAGEAGRVADLLAAASNASSAEITDIAMSMQQAGSSAAALHIPIEDLVTAIGEMANAGIKGSDAGTSLKTMMAALTPSTEGAAKAMKSLGIDAFDAKGAFVGFEAIIAQAAPALAKMTDEQKAYAIEAAFGSDAQRAANIILGKGVEEFNKMRDAVGQSGAAAELAAAKTKGLSGSWEGLISQLETAGLKVFQALAPTIENVVRKLADMTAGLAEVSPQIIKMGAAAAGVAATAGPLALLIGKLLTLGPQGVVAIAVIGGAAAMAAAYSSNFGSMTKVVDDFFRMFSTNVKSFEGAGTVLTKTLLYVVAGADRFIVALENIAVNVVTVGKLMIAAATGDWTSLATIWAEGRSKLDRIDSEYIERVRQRQIQLDAIQRGGMKELFTVLQNMSASGGEFAANAFGKGWDDNNPIPGIRKRATSEFSQMIDQMNKYGLLGGQQFGQGLKDGHDSKVYNSPHFLIHQTMAALATLFVVAQVPAENAGKKIASSVIKGHEVESGKKGIVHHTMTALGELEAVVEAPSTKAGKKIAAAMKKAFKEELGTINDWLSDFGGGLKLDEAIAKLLGDKTIAGMRELSKAADESKNKLQAWGITLQTAFSKAGGGLQVFLEDSKIKIKETSIQIVSAFGDLNQRIGIKNAELTKDMTHTGLEIIKIQAGVAKQLKLSTPMHPFEMVQSEKMLEAMKRTGADIIKIQTDSDDKMKAEAERASKVLAESYQEGLEKTKELFKETYDKLSGYVGKGLADVLVQVSKFTGTSLTQITKWAGGTLDIIGALPGKIGEKLKHGADVVLDWVNRIDTILQGLHKIFDKIPDGLGKAIESIAGMFKKSQATVKAGVEDWAGDLEKMSTGGAQSAGKSSGSSFAEGFLGQLATITAGVGMFFGTRHQGKAVGILGGALSGASIGASIGTMFAPGIGTAIGAGIGAVGGAIAGLFGSGKSKEQKEAEEKAKQAAALDMQRFVADLNNSILDGLNKGFELLEKLQTFSEVPRKAIKRFINEIFLILRTFVEMSAQFKAEGLAQAKLVSDNLGGAFSLLLSGADLVEKIRGIEAVTQKDVDNLFSSVDKILDGWFSLVEHIEKGVAKRASKMSGLLSTSLETIQLIPATIKAMTEVPDITDEQIDRPFVWGKRILDKFFDLADQFKTLALNRTVKTAEAFAKIFESGKSMFEFLKLWTDYKPLEDSAFDAVNSDFDRVTNWFLSAIDKSTQWLGLSETLRDNILHLAAEMGDISNAITGAFGGAGGGAQNFTVQQSTSNPLGLGATASSGGSTQAQAPVIINLNVNGSLIHQANLPNVLVAAFEEARKKGQIE